MASRDTALESLNPVVLIDGLSRQMAEDLRERDIKAKATRKRRKKGKADLADPAADMQFYIRRLEPASGSDKLVRWSVGNPALSHFSRFVPGSSLKVDHRDYARRLVAKAFDAIIQKDDRLFVIRNTQSGLSQVIASVIEQVPDAVHARRKTLTESNIEALVDVYLVNDPIAPALADIERDNAQARARYIEEVPALSAEDVSRLAGHAARNRSATAGRWRSKNQIFSVKHRGRDLYPAFQFQDGAPRPVIQEILAALPEEFSPWQIAFWFSGANGYLDGDRPQDRLRDRKAVVTAAEHEQQSWIG